MKKTSKVLGFISIFFTICFLIVFIDTIIKYTSPDPGWIGLYLYFVLIVFLVILIISSAAFVTFLILLKYKNMKFYTFSHLAFILVFGVSVILLASNVFKYNPVNQYEEQTLVVGSIEIGGSFMPGFGTNKADIWVRDLIFNYSTYATTPLGQIVLNETVVKTVTTETDTTTGDKTYTFVIHEDLLWSDDEKIMADDFVFSVLMQASKDWKNAGATSKVGESLVGYDLYQSGVTSADVRFKGVQLLGAYSFSLTIDASNVPYFYETTYVTVSPYPMHTLAPEGTMIDSNGNGAKVSYLGFQLFPDIVSVGGYRYAPTVSAGPYKFVSFTDQVVTLVKDDNFKGNYAGMTPYIHHIIIKRVNQTLDVDLVISGEINLVTGVIERSKIEEAKEAASTSTSFHTRNGYAMMSIKTDFGPTMDYKVRQAIAHMVDKELFADIIVDGYGTIISSDYNLSQWMYVFSEDWIEDNISKYSYSVASANSVLDSTEWTYEADGVTLFDASKAVLDSGYYRHNAQGDILEINSFKTESGMVQPTGYEKSLSDNMELSGVKYEMMIGNYETLLNHYYYSYDLEPEEKKYHMFFLNENLNLVYDPYNSWHSDWIGSWQNGNQLEDSVNNPNAPLETGEKTLDELTVLMREVEPGDYDTYLSLWREYQLRWNKLSPDIPLFSNQYYNVFNVYLKGVETTPFWDWTHQICNMYFELYY